MKNYITIDEFINKQDYRINSTFKLKLKNTLDRLAVIYGMPVKRSRLDNAVYYNVKLFEYTDD